MIGYEGATWADSINAGCGWGTYHGLPASGEWDTGIVCYSYSENRWFILSMNANSHDEHNPARGHPVGDMIYNSATGSLQWMVDGSGGLGSEPFSGHWWNFDLVGLTGSDRTNFGTHQSAWSSGGSTPENCAAFDTAHNIGLVVQDWQARASTYNPATNAWTQTSTTNVPGTASGFPACAFDSTNNLFYASGGGTADIWSYSQPTNTWTLITPASCTGADCSGGKPPSRQRGFLVYDSTDNILVMGGGSANGVTSPFSDTWYFDPVGLTWTEQSPGATYFISGQLTDSRAYYDSQSNAIVVWMLGGNYADGSYAGVSIFVYPVSTALGYGRTVNTYTPTANSLNVTAPTATSNTALGHQSYALEPSIVYDGTNLHAAWGETADFYDSTTCTGQTAAYVKSFAGGSWSQKGSGCSALASSTFPGGVATITGYHTHLASVAGDLWAVDIQFQNNVLYFPWAYSHHWTGSAWTTLKIGCFSITPCTSSISVQAPDALVDFGSQPTVALIETDNAVGTAHPAYLYVAQYNGSAWAALGSALNVNGSSSRVLGATLAPDGSGNLYVCWNESNNTDRLTFSLRSQIYCAKWNGSAWSSIITGAALNQVANSWAGRPDCTFNSVLYCAWTERTDAGAPTLISVSWNGSSLTVINSNLNHTNGGSAYGPRLKTDGSNTWIAWEEQSAVGQRSLGYVSKLVAGSWSAVGGGISAGAAGSIEGIDLAIAGTPAVVFSELSTGNLRQVYAKQWSGASWAEVGATSGGSVSGGSRTLGGSAVVN